MNANMTLKYFRFSSLRPFSERASDALRVLVKHLGLICISLFLLGLGLDIVKRLCERFDWHLKIDSSVGMGTAVSVTFQN